MGREQEDRLSEFIESVDDMIGRHFALDARLELEKVITGDSKNWTAAEEILYQLIRSSIAHARSQLEGRKTGTMTFEEAMQLVRTRYAMVTRPTWNIFCCLRFDVDGSLAYWKLDNCDGGWSGDGWPYEPTDQDRAATDWMLYQAPQNNWVELNFRQPQEPGK
jgi:hypothetical protein